MEDDGFQLVRPARRRPKQLYQSEVAGARCQPDSYPEEQTNEQSDHIVKRVIGIKHEILLSDTWNNLQRDLQDAMSKLSAPRVENLICYGLGSLTDGNVILASRYQLAFLLCLKELLGVPCLAYDPAFNIYDKSVLDHYGIEVFSKDHQAKYEVHVLTMFFMPRCPFELFNNLFWKNWNSLDKLIIIGNDLNALRLQHTDEVVRNQFFFIMKALDILKSCHMRVANTVLESILNNTSLQYFQSNHDCHMTADTLKDLEPLPDT